MTKITTNSQKRVFISYVKENRALVEKLCKDLTRHGIVVWLDRHDLEAGSRWKRAIRTAIRTGDFFIACFSAEYSERAKTYMNEELTLAVEELRLISSDRIWFIPVKLSECEISDRSIGDGEFLSDIHWVDLTQEWDAGIRHILKVIKPISPDVISLIQALENPEKDIRVKAAEKLGEKGDPSAIPGLKARLRDNNVAFQAALSLAKLGDPSGMRLIIPNLHTSYFMSKAREALISLGPKALPRVLRIFLTAKEANHWEAIYNCGHVLAEIADQTTIAPLIKTLSPSKSGSHREAAAFVLGRIGDPSAIPALGRALRHDPHKNVRLAAAHALLRIGTPEAIKTLGDIPWIEDAKKHELQIPDDGDCD